MCKSTKAETAQKAEVIPGQSTVDQNQSMPAPLTDLETFIRDANFAPGVFGKYKPGLVIQETGFIDVSEFESGPLAHSRYHVITNMANEFRESFVAYGAWTMPRGCFFKILDVLLEGQYALITLLQIPADQVAFYAMNQHSQEAEIVETSRSRFRMDLAKDPNPALDDEYWLRRTAFPIGIADDGTYFFQFDYGHQPKKDPLYTRKGWFRRWLKKS
ncbi:MAG: hypothetical protein IPN95_09150 [Bacteroidetes bacterium]|nr:hypothetical protein [Bacteroidota bacterium]MBP6640703.1 hypothetical protein [Bacteroidia bacterium]MBP6722198.1 hypothetical protein [Bacteroidia bacterium]